MIREGLDFHRLRKNAEIVWKREGPDFQSGRKCRSISNRPDWKSGPSRLEWFFGSLFQLCCKCD
jgi:hypothetical protein